MNATTQAIIKRLRKDGKPILQAADIAAAYGFKSTDLILADIKAGRLAANRPGGQYVISLEAAEAYIAANEYQPEEGTIKK
jgi:hypothetical protein